MTRTKRITYLTILAVVLCATLGLSLSLLAGAEGLADITVTIDNEQSVTLKDADGNGYYDIGTADELYAFATYFNGNPDNPLNGELTADIKVNENVLDENGDLNGDGANFRAWTPIGLGAFSVKGYYKGIFNGNDHTISGLYANYPNTDVTNSVGLFGSIIAKNDTCTSTKILNVGIVDSFFAGTNYVGGLVGMAGCYHGSELTVECCYNASTIRGAEYVGGLIGYFQSYYNDRYNQRGAATATVKNCYNTGKVNHTGGSKYAGGLIGYFSAINDFNPNPYAIANIENCFNYAEVTAPNAEACGGLVGFAKNRGCYPSSSTNAYTNIKNSYCLSTNECIGGSNNVNAGGVISVLKTEKKTDEDFSSGEVAYLLNNGDTETGVFKQTVGTGLPSLKGETVYLTSPCVSYTNDPDNLTLECSYGSGDVCENCGRHKRIEITPTEDGVYEISNLGQLLWFSDKVNDGDNAINGKLLADVDVSADSTFSIGTKDIPYKGIFDGNNHKLTIKLSSDKQYTAPFPYVENVTIKNLTVDGSINASDKFAAGLIGQINSNCSAVLENCLSLVKINSTVNGDGTHGGLVGVANGTLTANNCGFAGELNGSSTNSCGGFVGWANAAVTVSNSFVAVNKWGISASGSATFSRNDGKLTLTNCYYLTKLGDSSKTGTSRTASDFESGRVAYELNGNLSTGVWKQTIGTDAYPNFTGETVYVLKDCAGGDNYSNTQTGEKIHVYSDGFCTCGAYEPATKDSEGCYIISNAGQLFWFADYVNTTDASANAKLNANIDLKSKAWTAIGTASKPYTGTFDGNGKTVSNLSITATSNNQGLFGVVKGGTVKNFTVSGKIEIGVATGVQRIGGVVGWAYGNAKISDVTSNVTITDSETTSHTENRYIGGVVGYLGSHQGNDGSVTAATVEKCVYNGTLSLHKNQQIGGIVGVSFNSTVKNCSNNGSVTASDTDSHHVAGIVGSAQDGTTVTQCINYGAISSSGTDCTGGIVGYTNTASITYCGNVGTVTYKGTEDPALGGILGYVNNNGFKGLSYCYNYGTVSSEGGTTGIGAIVGTNKQSGSATYDKNYYLSTSCSSAHGTSGGGTKISGESATDSQFKSGEVAYKLNGSSSDGVWKQTLNTDGTPNFTGDTVRITVSGNDYTNKYVSVDISWTSMEFTYTDGKWNPTSHSYGASKWSTDGGTFTFANSGTYDVKITLSYTPTVNGITASFTQSDALLMAGKSVTSSLACAGKPSTELNKVKLGTVTVSIKAVDVSEYDASGLDSTTTNYTELKNAIKELLNESGDTVLSVKLPTDNMSDVLLQLRFAIADSGKNIPEGSVYLVFAGVTEISDTGSKGGGFGSMMGGDSDVAEVGSLYLPDATYIGENTFSACSRLTSLTAPKAQTVGGYAFQYTALTSLDLPQATTIGEQAFYDCQSMTSVKLPKATSIGADAFYDCSALTRLELTAEGTITLGDDVLREDYTSQIDLVLNKDKQSEVSGNVWQGYTFKSVTFVD